MQRLERERDLLRGVVRRSRDHVDSLRNVAMQIEEQYDSISTYLGRDFMDADLPSVDDMLGILKDEDER